jgi:hypothetical protein
MEDVSAVLPGLHELARRARMRLLIFRFTFKGLHVRGVYFDGPKTLTIGIADANVGWQADISGGKLSAQIPHEVYSVIKEALKDEAGGYANGPFFARLKAALEHLVVSGEAQQASDDELLELLATCKTKDKKYDKEGERPYFGHWMRVRPSPEGLAKIQRAFGKDIRERCYQHKVTGVWFDTPKPDSLIFLDPEAAIGRMPV